MLIFYQIVTQQRVLIVPIAMAARWRPLAWRCLLLCVSLVIMESFSPSCSVSALQQVTKHFAPFRYPPLIYVECRIVDAR